MFNLGFSEMILVGVIALVFIGPKQLPEIARVLGRMINEFKKATSDLSGGLLDIKNDLREPLEESLEAVNKIRADIMSRTESFVNSATDLDHLALHGPELQPDHHPKQPLEFHKIETVFNPPHVADDKTAEIITDNDPEKI